MADDNRTRLVTATCIAEYNRAIDGSLRKRAESESLSAIVGRDRHLLYGVIDSQDRLIIIDLRGAIVVQIVEDNPAVRPIADAVVTLPAVTALAQDNDAIAFDGLAACEKNGMPEIIDALSSPRVFHHRVEAGDSDRHQDGNDADCGQHFKQRKATL